MKRPALLSLAIASSAVALVAIAATRPRYGGALRIQLAGAVPQLTPAAANACVRDRALFDLVNETLVRLNARGEPESLLATSWQTDADRKHWRFTLRNGVVLHDGSQFTPAVAAAALASQLRNWFAADVAQGSQAIQVSSDRAMPDLLERLAEPECALPSGPFQSGSAFEGKMTLTAFEQHWRGRPFLDAIELLPVRPGPLQANAADVWEIPAGMPPRAVPERLQLWSSAPAELLAIENTGTDPQLAVRLSAAIDRSSMTSVLTHKRAEPAAAILPQWVSGYAFVFPAARDLDKAHGPQTPPVVLSYPATDPLARIVAERVAVNARDAGIVITPRADVPATLRIRRFALSPNGIYAVRRIASELGVPDVVPNTAADPEATYAAERSLLATGKVVPLMHIPLLFGYQAKIQIPPGIPPILPRLPFDSAWIAP